MKLEDFTKVKIDDATKVPEESGFYYLMADRWWAVSDDDCLLFYGKGKSAQCNGNKGIVERIMAHDNHPGTHVVFLKSVFLHHDCHDYV